jgi:hypothetical protein
MHLHTPLFVVMGHEGCGAVQAALASKFHGAQQASRIELLLENILPALDGLDATLPPQALMSAAVEANVRWTVRAMLESPEGKARAAFARLEGKKEEYIFVLDDNKDDPNSHGLAFRAGANFRLIAGAEFVNGHWIRMPPLKAATLYNQQLNDWVDIIDAN